MVHKAVEDFKVGDDMTSAQRVLLLIVVLVAILIGHLLTQSSIQEAQTQSRQTEDTPSFSTPIEEEDFASDRILVKPKQGVSDEAVERLNQENDASTEEKLPRAKVSVVELPEELPVEEAVERYEDSPDIEFAEPDFILKPSQTTTTANDPNYSQLYGLNNTGQTGGTSGADIDAPEAWSTTTGSTSTVVAVIDTGTDIKHPDLKNNIWTNPGETAGNGIDDDRNGYVDDVNGWDFANNDASVFDSASEDSHGTHVAGIIAAEGNNNLGVVGVNWKAKIMPLKFLGG
jgi:thermitase